MTNIEAMRKSAEELRGKILQHAIGMELRIDIYISNHFSKDEEKRMEMIILLISQNGLNNKKEILQYLLTEKEAKLSQPDRKAIITNIANIIEERNVFAHWPVDFSIEAQEIFRDKQILSFVRLKQGRIEGQYSLGLQKGFTESKVDELIKAIDSINDILDNLINKSGETASPAE